MGEDQRSWEIVKGTPEDLDNILDLKMAVNPETDRDLWASEWRWHFLKNPYGQGLFYLAQTPEGLAGYYGVIRRDLLVDGRIAKAAFSGGTMTHPDFRRQGIFSELAKAAFEDSAASGIEVIYGFPNRYSRPGFIRHHNWVDIAILRGVVRPLHWDKFLETRFKNKAVRTAAKLIGQSIQGISKGRGLGRILKMPCGPTPSIELVDEFEESFDNLFTRDKSKNTVSTLKSANILNWRYVRKPGTDYDIAVSREGGEVTGFAIGKVRRRAPYIEYSIVEIYARSLSTCNHLIDFLVEESKRKSADVVTCNLPRAAAQLSVFRRLGFIPLPKNRGARLCGRNLGKPDGSTWSVTDKAWLIYNGARDTY